jgi:hypothetical protein
LAVVRSTTSRPTGTIIAPPAPCRTRVAVSTSRLGAAAHAAEASVNSAIASVNTRRAPNRSASQPLIGMSTARVRT